MKVILLKNRLQILKIIPEIWKDLPNFNLIKKDIRPNQKYGKVNLSCIDNIKKTVTVPIIDLSDEEYQAKLQNEAFEIIESLKDIIATLEVGAKKIAINKDGSRAYIETQERIYERKYKMAKGELLDVNDLLKDEAVEFGYSWDDYKLLIISKYEAGRGAFDLFMSMIERSRSKVLFFLETNKNYKAIEVLELMKSIKTTTPISEILETMNLILKYK